MKRKLCSYLVAVLALTTCFAFQSVQGQSSTPSFAFRPGQSMYIVAFRRSLYTIDANGNVVPRQEFLDNDLDGERKVRKRIEEWQFFKVADKLSEADFVFLVNLEDSSIEGLAIPLEAYRQHFKDKFDLDALREAAYGRYLIGPLKLATVTRLSDRLVKLFREKLSPSKMR